MDDEAPSFRIGRGASWVRVSFVRRAHPGANDFWDGNWVDSVIEVHAGAFRARIDACLRSSDVEGFREQLRVLRSQLGSRADFTNLEPWMKLSLIGDERGHFAVSGEARDRLSGENRLHFELEFDQTELPPLLRELDAILQAFPVLGAP